jgi:hypothetical protein
MLSKVPRLPNSDAVLETSFSLRALTLEHAMEEKFLPYELKRKVATLLTLLTLSTLLTLLTLSTLLTLLTLLTH